ncbi:hypothetical protein A3I95_03005 [Candidatus Nomurabacteria bacterium RIFCSPLOWO2_02_FULL_44_12]|uniref:Sortase n=1 Tax=Candidatus Nomurabacteria bacterium RIFCSPLOWO2_12_FULL_44_11 TaxID=1801796 RepID=A0A1F6Y3M4_9BACT|nr:MAG: hypothetical protein A3E95_00220 [Candidatus Nomurabacteria bacterium RIFCSPHIGHO2_12_FULL_44_22b]OGJ00980.1 MAG: hypothetical protein A3G53_02945 [Candidatus Nomurabacteria bacterium RIFCSPLOWO2_12_FULL_44_11]OGJ08235.1 MAG: hypothetical protein A3I95_03005 [Candidatus Nomurabacteria bacterium RIFCSPLOWO2_02_FULL_44_12]
MFYFGRTVYRAVSYAPTDEVALPNDVKKTFSPEEKKINPVLYPQYLRIPSIGVKAKVQKVGITKLGNMSTPNNYTDVGWFKYGTLPGEVGSAVISGHVDNGLGMPAVFADLKDVKVGSDVYIDQASGDTLHFVVRDIKTYDYKAPTEEIFNQNDAPLLKLITCTGSWISEYRTHNQRLVITAVESSP